MKEMNRRRATALALGAFLTGVGAISSTWASSELASGVREIPQHWWSVLAVLPLGAGVAITAITALRRPRSST